jgi:hypothetical protein
MWIFSDLNQRKTVKISAVEFGIRTVCIFAIWRLGLTFVKVCPCADEQPLSSERECMCNMPHADLNLLFSIS